MDPLQPSQIRIATACPAEVAEGDWVALAAMLDTAERQLSARFIYQTDRRAFILARALRRALLAGELGVAPDTLRFDENAHGKPALAEPCCAQVHFSHSRSRLGVACAVTRLAPVGIDVEPVDAMRADMELLAPYVALDDSAARGKADFFRYWTALEAFWKSVGTGLARGNPRLRLEADADRMQVHFESGENTACGMVLSPAPLPGCAIAVALRMPFTGEPVMDRMHCRGARDIGQLGKTNRTLKNSPRPEVAA